MTAQHADPYAKLLDVHDHEGRKVHAASPRHLALARANFGIVYLDTGAQIPEVLGITDVASTRGAVLPIQEGQDYAFFPEAPADFQIGERVVAFPLQDGNDWAIFTGTPLAPFIAQSTDPDDNFFISTGGWATGFSIALPDVTGARPDIVDDVVYTGYTLLGTGSYHLELEVQIPTLVGSGNLGTRIVSWVAHDDFDDEVVHVANTRSVDAGDSPNYAISANVVGPRFVRVFFGHNTGGDLPYSLIRLTIT